MPTSDRDGPRSDPTSRLADEFEPSPLPPIAPDGGLALEPVPIKPLRRVQISLCALGPCANYHEVLTKIDAQDPLDGSPGKIHLMPVRTCYPHPGIEMDLKDMPVRECNRWNPLEVTNQLASPDLLQKSRRDIFIRNRADLYNDFLTSWTTANEETPDGDR
jgi:hypothetical protein